MRKKKTALDVPTEYSKLYDEIYGTIAYKKRYRCSTSTKSDRMDRILSQLDYKDVVSIRSYYKYHDFGKAAKLSGMDKRILAKNFDIAKRHLYSPKLITIAMPYYYSIAKSDTQHKLTIDDFEGNKYILSALERSGLDTRERLLKHLANGWYFLWTIPGCGDNARQCILMAIDKWNNA